MLAGLISDLLVAVVTVCVPIFTAYIVKAIQKAGDNAAADTEDLKVRGTSKRSPPLLHRR